MRIASIAALVALALALVPAATADGGFETPPVPNDGQPGFYIMAQLGNDGCFFVTVWSSGEYAPPVDIKFGLPLHHVAKIDVRNSCTNSQDFFVSFFRGRDVSSADDVRLRVLPGVDTTLGKQELMTLGTWGYTVGSVGGGGGFPPDFILSPSGLTPA